MDPLEFATVTEKSVFQRQSDLACSIGIQGLKKTNQLIFSTLKNVLFIDYLRQDVKKILKKKQFRIGSFDLAKVIPSSGCVGGVVLGVGV